MPTVSVDNPPASVEAVLGGLRTGLSSKIPAKHQSSNLLIGTWNIRAFGGLTEKWESAASDSPKRNLADVCAIAEIISRFDVVALQETRDDLSALRTLMQAPGTALELHRHRRRRGPAGNGERLAYLFDTKRVRLTGLAGELVVPEEWFGEIKHGALRAPVRPHSLRGQLRRRHQGLHPGHPAHRLRQEARRPADGAGGDRRLAGRAGQQRRRVQPQPDRPRRLQHRPPGRPQLAGLHRQGPDPALRAPRRAEDDLRQARQTTASSTRSPGSREGDREALTLTYKGKAGYFPWTDYLLGDLANTPKSWRISDHYPLWAEFSLS